MCMWNAGSMVNWEYTGQFTNVINQYTTYKHANTHTIARMEKQMRYDTFISI